MNKAYRMVWSKARSAYVVTHEKSSSRGRPSTCCVAMAAGTVALLLAAAPALGANICTKRITTIDSVQISGDICTLANGTGLVVNETGGLSNTGAPVVTSTGNVGNIINKGIIGTDSRVAIYLDSGRIDGNVYNSGTINSVFNDSKQNNGAIYANNATITGSLINDGGTINNQVAFQQSSVTSIKNINTGVINVSEPSISGIHLVNTRVAEGILNDATSSINSSGYSTIGLYASTVGTNGIINQGQLNKGSIHIYNKSLVKGDVINTASGKIKDARNAAAINLGFSSTVMGMIKNEGNIINSRFGITVASSTVNEGIANSGTIQATEHGIFLLNSDNSWAVNNGISNTGVLSGDQFGIAIKNATLNGTLNPEQRNYAIYNNNQILGSASQFEYSGALYIESSKINGDIINDTGGTIGGSIYGIFVTDNSAIKGALYNNGNINGSQYALYVTDDSTLTDIFATGNNARFVGDVYAKNSNFTVTAGSTFANDNAINVQRFLVEQGGALTIKNGGSSSDQESGITVGSGGFVNAGAVRVNAGTTAAIHGDVDQANTGTFSIGDNGSTQTTKLTIDGILGNRGSVSIFGKSILSAATLTNNGSVTLGNAAKITTKTGFTNNGTLTLGTGVNASVTGNYTQSAQGALNVAVTDDTTYAKLAVDGTATLSSNAKINVDVTKKDYQFSSKRLKNIITATQLLSDGSFQVSSNSLLFKFGAVKDGNAVHLTLEAKAKPDPKPNPKPDDKNDVPTVLGSAIEHGNKHGMNAASALDRIIGRSPMGDLASKFVSMTDKKSVSQAVTQTLPLLSGGSMAAASGSVASINRVVQARIESNRGLSSGDEFLGDKYLWMKPFTSWAKQNDSDGIAGFSASTSGFVLGLDGTANGALRLGAGIAYASSKVNGNSSLAPQSMNVDVFQLLGYGSYSLDERTELNFQADIGQNNNQGSRTIAFSNSTASAKYKSLSAHAGVGVGRIFALNESTNFTPSLRLDYAWIRDQAYAEKGADALNLNVNGRSTRELTAGIDGKLAHVINEKTTLTANLGVGYDLINDKSAIVAAYAGAADVAFATYGMEKSPWSMRAGLGASHKITNGTELTARYDAEGRSGFINQTVSVKARWAF